MEKIFKISTIIPVYNTEKYLAETLSCILQQTMKFCANIQIIFVDDNSTDHSGMICRKYQALYPDNIIYLKLEKNSGASIARNTGLKYARGKYVNFLDSDDKWSENAYQRMYDFLERNDNEIDMVSCNVWYFEANEHAHALNQQHDEDCIIDIVKDYGKIRSLGSNCLVKRETAEEFPFNEKQRCWEDSLFINTVILNKKKYGMLTEDVRFYYRMRKDQTSATNLLYNKSRRYYLEDLTYLFEGIYKKSMEYCGCFTPMCQYFMVNALQVRFREEINTAILESEEIKTYENILRNILLKIEDKYICEIAYADDLLKKIMLAYKYGIDFREDIAQLKEERDSAVDSNYRTKENNKLLVRWMWAIRNGKTICTYFETYGYHEIAVYGVSDIGKLVIEELKYSDIRLQYGIDKNAAGHTVGIPVYKPDDRLPSVDMIVVTAVYFFNTILKQLQINGVQCPVISLNEILDFIE